MAPGMEKRVKTGMKRVVAILIVLLGLLAADRAEGEEDVLGSWYFYEAVYEQAHIPAAEVGMDMTICFRDDGTVWVESEGDISTGTWTRSGNEIFMLDTAGITTVARWEDGHLRIDTDGVELRLGREMPDMHAGETGTEPKHDTKREAERDTEVRAADFEGVWVSAWIHKDNVRMESRAIGIHYVLHIREDRAALDLDADGTAEGACSITLAEGVLTLRDEAGVSVEAWLNTDGSLTLDGGSDGAIIFLPQAE